MQILEIQNDIEREIPRDIVQAQGQRTTHRLVHHHVEIADLTKEAENVMEIGFVKINTDPTPW
ncbi:MAG: hypothetical protein U5J62_00180 [Desulfurivibrio sp.]|nr:hypothetical protein [Desulfurivibrio sp.]